MAKCWSIFRHIPATDNHQSKLVALQEKLQASNASSKIIYKVADVGDYEAVDAAVASAVEELGKIDILINNVRPYGPRAWKHDTDIDLSERPA
jgi:NAD(P)-dependent dehydrogenase (short-subunit alcohol dehydrogenase family)